MSTDRPEPRLVKCPDCKGKQRVFAHVNYGGARPGEFKHIDCTRCKGIGAVLAEMLEWIEEGKKIRAERVSRDVTLGEEAKRLGMSASELSAIETGRVAVVTPTAYRMLEKSGYDMRFYKMNEQLQVRRSGDA